MAPLHEAPLSSSACLNKFMEHPEYQTPTLESLLREMIANQHSIDETVRELYEKVDRIEQKLEKADALDEKPSREDQVEELFEDAKEAVVAAGKASTSYLQRKLRVGYSVAAGLMDELEREGVIGPADGSKPREILVGEDDEDDAPKKKAVIHGD